MYPGSAAKGARDALVDALGVDGVLTVAQAARLVQIEPRQVAAVVGHLGMVRVGLVRPTAGSAAQSTGLVALTDAGAAVAAARLGRPVRSGRIALHHEVDHALGVAELRHVLQVPPERWTSATELLAASLRDGREGRGLPDGLADLNGNRVAVEYDHGNYVAAQIAAKQRVAARLADRAIWAAPTPRRADWLRGHGCADVLVVRVPR